jgi:hypothetical protein
MENEIIKKRLNKRDKRKVIESNSEDENNNENDFKSILMRAANQDLN